ncbi:MAG: hypothetical protein HS102_08230 [Planctomycetia bacterium]|nr:hypothetical protein [Planctomycetia bacterium]
MLSVTRVGKTREDWCRYFKHVPLFDPSRALRCVVASLRLSRERTPDGLQAYDGLLHAFVNASALVQGSANGQGLVQQALRAFTGVDGVAQASCAAGLFAADAAVIVASTPVEVHVLDVNGATRQCAKRQDSYPDTRTLRIFELTPKRLHAVLIPGQAGLLPDPVAGKLFTPGDHRGQVIDRLCAWIRKRTDMPTLVLVYGHTASEHDSLFPEPSRLAEAMASPDAAQAVTPASDAIAAIQLELEKLSTAATNHRDLVPGVEEALSAVRNWPAPDLYRGLLQRLEAAQAEQVDNSVVLPLCRHLMHLHDTIHQALQERVFGGELLEALDGKVLSVLEEHGLAPFHESGSAFNPRTQEAVGQPPRNESFIMRPLRCGFRRGSSVVRREKVEFSSVSRSLVESRT